ELAAAEHELSVAQEKESMLQVEALELDRKKQQLTHEIEDAIAAEERRLKPQIEGLHKDIRDIGDQIDATSKSFDAKREFREGLLSKEQQLREAIERTNNVVYEAKLEFTRVEKEPERAKKQAEIVVKAHASAEKQLSSYQEQLAQQLKELAQLAERKKQLNDQQCDLVATLTTNETEITSKKASIVDLNKHLSYEMENRGALQARVADNETLEHEASVEFNRVRDELNRMLRGKDAGMKEFKRIEQAKADLQSETEIYRKQMEILKREQHRLSEQRRAAATELEELKRDVDILINSFLKEEIAERRCVKDKESLHGEIRGLEDQVAARAQLEQEQKRTLSDLAVKREQCSRECSRNQGRVMLARNE
ncbi:MAG: hypothetical protein Q8J97_03185, partial [Flavobacteriaceae bacterium]|nr:hypothetical protein [Flavobacteriaceae bacterium]